MIAAKRQRYTLSHLAHDVKSQTGLANLPATGSDFLHEHVLRLGDLIKGHDADWGQLSCGCHPNCGTGMAIMIDKERRKLSGHGVPEGRSVGEGYCPRSTMRLAESFSRSSAWRWR